MTLLLAQSSIEPGHGEAIWRVASFAFWILLIVATVLVANWVLNRVLGKPICWPRRWARKTPSIS